MKHIYSLSFFAIVACLVSTESIAARHLKEFVKIFEKFSVEELSTMLELKKIDVAHKQNVQELYARLSKTAPQEGSFVKAGISKLIAALAAGYYLGMNHEKIEKKFDEQVRPAITLSSEITLPTKEQAETFFEETTEKIKNTIKHIALKHPEQAETITETKSEQENQNS